MRSAPQNFTIGKLATAAGVPTTTVRYYERVGLLTPDARTGRNYRSYTAATLERLQFIRTAQSAGLSLDDVANVIRLADEDGVPCAAVQAIMRQRLAQIEQRLAEQKQENQKIFRVPWVILISK